MLRKKKKKNKKAFAFLFLVLLLVSLGYFTEKEYLIYQVEREATKTQARVERLQVEQKQLLEEKSQLDNLQYIEKLAREEHNMVGKGEVPLFIIEKKMQEPQ
ncbi:MAG: septum formation initiator family protein [Acidaminococcaceae bacterium]